MAPFRRPKPSYLPHRPPPTLSVRNQIPLMHRLLDADSFATSRRRFEGPPATRRNRSAFRTNTISLSYRVTSRLGWYRTLNECDLREPLPLCFEECALSDPHLFERATPVKLTLNPRKLPTPFHVLYAFHDGLKPPQPSPKLQLM